MQKIFAPITLSNHQVARLAFKTIEARNEYRLKADELASRIKIHPDTRDELRYLERVFGTASFLTRDQIAEIFNTTNATIGRILNGEY